MMTAANVHYEHAGRVKASVPAVSARFRGGSEGRLDRVYRTSNLDLLKRHLPYHESDHVLNIAFNILAGGQRIEHLELRRNDEVYLDALGAKRIPDPTTEGDFRRASIRATSRL